MESSANCDQCHFKCRHSWLFNSAQQQQSRKTERKTNEEVLQKKLKYQENVPFQSQAADSMTSGLRFTEECSDITNRYAGLDKNLTHIYTKDLKRKQMWEVFGVQCDKTEPNYTKGVTSKTLLASFSYEFQTKVLDTLYTGVLHHTEDITHLEWMVWLYMNPSYHVRRYRPALQLVILSAHVPWDGPVFTLLSL